MVSNGTIISSTIPQLPKEIILDGINYLDWELCMMDDLHQNNCKSSPKPVINPRRKDLASHYCSYKGHHIQVIVGKREWII